jgi:predicted Zn-dependent peptidase
MIGTIAYPATDPRRWALYLLNNLLGGPSLNSRLNIALRERRGLVYTVESSMTCYSDTGLWSVYFGCDPADVKRCLRIVKKELVRLANQPLTEVQLNKAKQQLRGQLTIAADNREQFAIDFARSFLHEGRVRRLDEVLAHVDCLTSQQLQQTACELFAENRLVTLIYR